MEGGDDAAAASRRGVTGRPLATTPEFPGIFGISARPAALLWDTVDTGTLRGGGDELSARDGLTAEVATNRRCFRLKSAVTDPWNRDERYWRQVLSS